MRLPKSVEVAIGQVHRRKSLMTREIALILRRSDAYTVTLWAQLEDLRLPNYLNQWVVLANEASIQS